MKSELELRLTTKLSGYFWASGMRNVVMIGKLYLVRIWIEVFFSYSDKCQGIIFQLTHLTPWRHVGEQCYSSKHLILSTIWGWMVSFTLRALETRDIKIPVARSPWRINFWRWCRRYPLYRRLCGPQVRELGLSYTKFECYLTRMFGMCVCLRAWRVLVMCVCYVGL